MAEICYEILLIHHNKITCNNFINAYELSIKKHNKQHISVIKSQKIVQNILLEYTCLDKNSAIIITDLLDVPLMIKYRLQNVTLIFKKEYLSFDMKSIVNYVAYTKNNSNNIDNNKINKKICYMHLFDNNDIHDLILNNNQETYLFLTKLFLFLFPKSHHMHIHLNLNDKHNNTKNNIIFNKFKSEIKHLNIFKQLTSFYYLNLTKKNYLFNIFNQLISLLYKKERNNTTKICIRLRFSLINQIKSIFKHDKSILFSNDIQNLFKHIKQFIHQNMSIHTLNYV